MAAIAGNGSLRGRKTVFALYGSLLVVIGIGGFVFGAFLGLVRLVTFSGPALTHIIERVVWYSAMPVVLGSFLIAVDVLFTVRGKRREKVVRNDRVLPERITVALTAYNDEESIGPAVCDFLQSRYVKRVIVVSNNSADRTVERASEAGALVVNEPVQGYGSCVMRALSEAAKWEDTPIVALCEGDMTFRAADLTKLLAYIPHADVVNGTRIVEQLQGSRTQISTFIHYGNFAVAKLLEMKYLGDATLSDAGTTYKIIRSDVLKLVLPNLNPAINLEFNPHFLETCIAMGFAVIECPITFHRRVGISKGGNASNGAAVRVGLAMIWGILAGWARRRA